MVDEKITLKEAREKGKLDQFIKEHEKDAPGDSERLDKTIEKIAREKAVKPSNSN